MNPISFQPIGVVHSCFKEKFGIPRQSGLAPTATADIELLGDFADESALVDLDQFSHIWICFVFHQNLQHRWRPQVRPPRLGGNAYTGVFATRSGVRPNPIGWSVVRYHGYRLDNQKLLLSVSGVDVVDGTPVLDIKPYIPYADAIPDARAGYAQHSPSRPFTVIFSIEADAALQRQKHKFPTLADVIMEIASFDARPAYYQDNDKKKVFGTRIYDFEVKWHVEQQTVTILSIDTVVQ